MLRKYALIFCVLFGAAGAPRAQTTVVDSFQVDGVYRSFRLYIPAAFRQAARPLVLNMHGLGSNAVQQQLYGNFTPVADTAGFYVVMPQGTYYSGTAFWNVGFPGTPDVDDVKFLSVLIDTLAARYPVDRSRVYATGLSNGGYMSHLLGIRLNNKIAAIASVAGSIVPDVFPAASPGRVVPALQVHGTADPTVPYNGFQYGVPVDSLISFWVRNNGCNATPVLTPVPNTSTTDGCTADHFVWSGGRNGATVELYRINGGAHTWPGAPAIGGVTNQDFSASREIWRFFSQYRLEQFTAVADASAKMPSVIITPNPARQQITVRAAGSGTSVITDLSGRVVLRSSEATIDVAALPSGAYWLEFSAAGGGKAGATFIKE